MMEFLHIVWPPPVTTSRFSEVDIVFVHGLNPLGSVNHGYNTWTHDDGSCWPVNELPKHMPWARIMIFAYNASVAFNAASGNVRTHAVTLLSRLMIERQDRLETMRPIIFVCHSLGGIVTKQALVRAVVDAAEYEPIRLATFGLVFFGTPHCGGNGAATAKLIANILSVATGGARNPLLSTLRSGSLYNEAITDDFNPQLKNYEVLSFWEARKTRLKIFGVPFPHFSEYVVDRESAKSGKSGEVLLSIDSNHSDMCKFSLKVAGDADRFAPVRFNLMKMAGKAREKAQSAIAVATADQVEDESFRSLYFTEMDYRRSHFSLLHQNQTCGWVFDHPEYCTWLRNPGGPLWIKGKPGTGKSTLIRAILKNLEGKKSNDEFILDFFFYADGRNPLQKSALGMCQTLLYQLMKQSPTSRSRFGQHSKNRTLAVENKRKKSPASPSFFGQFSENGAQEMENIRKQVEWSDDDQSLLRAILTEELESLIKDSRRIVIIIDAVDEAMHSETDNVVTYLCQLEDRLRQLSPAPEAGNFRICISCRHYPVTVAEAHRIVLENQNSDDITAYIKAEFAMRNVQSIRELKESDGFKTLEQTLITKSGGIFQWVSSILPFVVDLLKRGKDLDQALKALDEELPLELGERYAKILSTVVHKNDRLDAYTLLQWATRAREPLLLLRLGRQIRFSDAFSIFRYEMHPQIERKLNLLEVRVGSYSGGLMEVKSVDGSKVAMFLHPTVKIYLGREGLKRFKTESGISVSDELMLNSTNLDQDEQQVDVESLPGSSRTNARSSHHGTVPIRSEDHSWPETAKYADQWFAYLKERTHPLFMEDSRGDRRVKISLLSSGIDLNHPLLSKSSHLLKDVKSFVPGHAMVDNLGHGTFSAAVIWQVAPNANLFVARCIGNNIRDIDGDIIAEAIECSIREWEVDILLIPFGFSNVVESIEAAIRRAYVKNVVILAPAGSDTGWSDIAFPASMPTVTSVFSTDGLGNKSASTPTPAPVGDNFAFVGENVMSAWPIQLNMGYDSKRLSGSSVAAAVAAGTVALVFEFAWRYMVHTPLSELVQRPDVVTKLLRYMVSKRDGLDYVVPWTLLDASQGVDSIAALLQGIIGV